MDPAMLDIAKTLTATFVGAGLAFASNLLAQRAIRRRQERQAGNVAATIVGMQLHDFVNFRLGFLDGLEEPKREFGEIPHWILARPLQFTFSDSLKQDLSKLVFLGDHGGAETIQHIIVAERRYLDLAERANEFNQAAREKQVRYQQLWRERPFEITELLGDTPEAKDRLRRFEHALGLELVGRLDGLIESLIDRFTRDETDYSSAITSLHESMRATFKKKIFKVERLEVGMHDGARAERYKADRYRPMSVQLDRR